MLPNRCRGSDLLDFPSAGEIAAGLSRTGPSNVNFALRARLLRAVPGIQITGGVPAGIPGEDAQPRGRGDAVANALRLAAHELLEPLVIAEGYVTLVHSHLDPRAQEDARAKLAAAGRALARARIVAEAIMLDPVDPDRELLLRPVDLGRLVAECVELLEPEITARDVTVRVGELPTVNGEEALLGAVVSNLLVNGLRHGPAHGATIEVSAERRGSVWRVAVASNGPPIPEEAREVIFLPHHRGRVSTDSRGHGLGLAICRRIVERHGGEISFERRTDGANVFVVTLLARDSVR